MTNEGLPRPASSEGRMLLIALQEYSDNCQAPTLTPSCPFYQEESGEAWCGEECLGVLGKFGQSKSSHGVALGRALFAKPRGRPADKATTTKPFDAREAYLQDLSKPLETWRVASLLIGLQETILQEPNELDLEKRRQRVAEMIAGLETRGITPELAMKPILNTLAVMITVIAMGDPQRGDEDPGLGVLVHWRRAIGAAVQSDPNQAGLPPVVQFPRVSSWLGRSSLKEMLAWTPPSETDLLTIPNATDDTDLDEGHWLSDRFTRTYLQHWSSRSLNLEWQYLAGAALPPCPERVMRSRVVPKADLAIAIVSSKKYSESDTSGKVDVSSFVFPAREHLTSGRRNVAAALFEACVQAAPRNAEAHNNFGFCLIPDDPGKALKALNVAADLGLEGAAVNTANRVLALWRMGQVDSALSTAEAFIEAGPSPGGGFLWSFASEEPEIVDIDDATVYVKEMALAMALAADDQQAAKFWRSQLTER